MENKLIVAVCSRPIIYDFTDYNYRNRNMKEDAWRSISEEIGVPVEACRKKWKNLRDMYLKEKKKESEKTSVSAAVAVKRWKYSAILSFLDPFFSRCANIDPGVQDQTTEYDPLPPGAATVAKQEPGETSGFGDGLSPSPEVKPPLAGLATADASSGPSGTSSSVSSPFPPGTSSVAAGPKNPQRRKRRQAQEEQNMDSEILQILKDAPKNTSATEHFFLSLVPMMEQLPPRRQEVVKMRIQAIMFEEVYGGVRRLTTKNRDFSHSHLFEI